MRMPHVECKLFMEKLLSSKDIFNLCTAFYGQHTARPERERVVLYIKELKVIVKCFFFLKLFSLEYQ